MALEQDQVLTVGVDLGGTNLRVAAYAPDRGILDSVVLRTRLEAGPLSARFLRGIQPLERIAKPVTEVTEEHESKRSQWFTTAAVMLFVALALYLVGLK